MRGDSITLIWTFRKTAAALAFVLMGALCLLLLSDVAHAKPPLGRKWPAAQRISMDQVDHSAFDALLAKHVDGDGFVDYSAWKRSAADRRLLLQYLSHLSRASRSKPSSKEARLAFWINAYNALTIEGILQEYPTTSIRNHTARLFGYNIWQDLPLYVGDSQYSLEQIEHQILRKLGEPRIHFAIVCASIGCPRLRNEAYTAKRLSEQLADNAKDFFSRKQNLRVDRNNKILYVSSILDWFGSDFGDSHVQIFRYLKPYLPQSAKAIAADADTRVKYLDYDWSLNDQSQRK